MPLSRNFPNIVCLLLVCLLTAAASAKVAAQGAAVIAPGGGELSQRYAELLTEELRSGGRVIDTGMAETAFRALEIETPFNMTADDARRSAAAIGCRVMVLINAGSTPRTSLEKGTYHEAYAAIYVVSGRSGKLVHWRLWSFESKDAGAAEKELAGSARPAASEIWAAVGRENDDEAGQASTGPITEVPAENSPDAAQFRPPQPYVRIKPVYTETAFLYGIQAVVEAEADIAADGRVLRTAIVRWAGFGLDDAVEAAIRKMDWMPGSRRGKPLAVRVLLRYNFKKIEKE